MFFTYDIYDMYKSCMHTVKSSDFWQATLQITALTPKRIWCALKWVGKSGAILAGHALKIL